MEDVAAEVREIVFFEVPARANVERLCKRIRPRWPGATVRDQDVWFVTAAVASDAADLALLLREVEAALSELGLHSLRYCLDGRFYVMKRLRLVEGAWADHSMPPRHVA